MMDRSDFEAMLERRLRAHAATVASPLAAQEIARSTMTAAARPVGWTSSSTGSTRPRRPALLLGLAAALLLAVAGAAIIGGRAPAIDGVFIEGPSLDDGRIVNAIALPDGRVLVGVEPEEGTVPGTTTLDCSEPCRSHLALLDPRTGAFTPTQELPTSLAVASMALLHDGRVLIVNGSPDSDDEPTATIYDPATDRFEDVGAPLESRSWPFLVTLADGRVLVGGGEASSATTELFDPKTGRFSPAGAMTRARGFGASATLLRDGRVLVVGGGPEVGNSAEVFDPSTDAFAPTGPLTVARGGFHSATLLPDGRALIAGGLVSNVADPQTIPATTATAEVYDPATGTFSAVGPMAAPRFAPAASVLSDGTVLVAGGGHEILPQGTPVAAADAEIFDPSTGTFRPTGSLHRERLWPVAVAVDERVLVLGHRDPTGGDPVTGATSEWFE